ncbi:mechanosensitive ion channel family protein [Dongia soli]|uniref:Mechanosensitive ion channel family protein n=1 Tax=Dongia soli TaxID=600628 RepID=A0ABU5EDZ9_9PROT|nr:mechanosensitive ion channel family protein [Dongia soli]MDY0884593.1 mechanosensitive ion channel family protein [Dongia soli]
MRYLLFFLLIAGLLAAGPVLAQSPAPGSSSAGNANPASPSPEKLRELTDLLGDPAIQAWLRSQAQTPGQSPARSAPATGETAERGGMGAIPAAMPQHMVASWLDAIQAFIRQTAAAVPAVPAEMRKAWTILSFDIEEHGLFSIVLLLGVFLALGAGVERIHWWLTTSFRKRVIAAPLRNVHDRLRIAGIRMIYGLSLLAAVAMGSVGAFLLFDWPPLLREIVLAYLLLFLIVRLVLILGRIILAPGAERFRLLPMATVTAHFWFIWSAVLTGYFFFVKFSLGLLKTLGMSRPALDVIALASGIGLLALALFVAWRCPAMDGRPRLHRFGTWLLSAYMVAVWLVLLTGSYALFYVGLILLLLPIVIHCNQLAVKHVLRPPSPGGSGEDAAGENGAGATGTAEAEISSSSLISVSLERGLRALLLIGGAFLIAHIFDFDLSMLAAQDTMAIRLLRGVLHAVVILLIADVVWHMLKALIDSRLHLALERGQGNSDEAGRQARLRTLLPILRNILFVGLATITVLTALSALGIEIGPLIAGAGVVGVAIGFGAQTLVKDIISGMFYLLDDAFRVGEYIQSGSYKGTVESFSLRSVKLRHHRGPLYTVPFGVLGAIQNMSRDWVIDKLTVGVPYDTDLDMVKKLIKEIGKELKNDPELAPHIIESLKMQGVEQFGDYAIQIRMKMMTKPGEQFVIRRRAFDMIKKAFAANDIRFAQPTVQVAGEKAAVEQAAAQTSFSLTRPSAVPE